MSTRLVHMFDTAYPPDIPVPNCAAVAGYIGGNTPHMWSRDEWHRFSHLRQLPIWTGYQEDGPTVHAAQAVRIATGLGWRPFSRVRRAIALDYETEIDPAWVNAFADKVKSLGFITLIYGSLSFVKTNRRRGGFYWGADYNGDQHLPAGPFVAEQYLGNAPFRNTQVDMSVMSRSFLKHLGRGPRK